MAKKKRIISVGTTEVKPKKRKASTIYVDIYLRSDGKTTSHAYSKKEFECIAFDAGIDGSGSFLYKTKSVENQSEIGAPSPFKAVPEEYDGFIKDLSNRNNGVVEYDRLIQDATELRSFVENIQEVMKKLKK